MITNDVNTNDNDNNKKNNGNDYDNTNNYNDNANNDDDNADDDNDNNYDHDVNLLIDGSIAYGEFSLKKTCLPIFYNSQESRNDCFFY